MIRRFALAAVTALVCTALVADVAGAFTRREAICVKAARSRARQSLIDARTASQTTLTNDLQACFGDTTGCVSGCLATQAANQKPYKDAITACQNDQCSAGTDPTKCACKKSGPAIGMLVGNTFCARTSGLPPSDVLSQSLSVPSFCAAPFASTSRSTCTEAA